MSPKRWKRARPYNPAWSEVTCILCGAVSPTLESQIESDKSLVVLEEAELETYRKRVPFPDHLILPSTVVERANFTKFPYLSSCYYRAIVKSCSTSEYYLTGIGLTGPPSCKGQFIYLPRDKNSAQICSRKIISTFDNARFRQFFLAGVEDRHSKNYKGKNMGFPFHAHCWEILRHLLGKDTIEKRPGAIVQAAREYWRSGNIEYAPIWGIDHTMDLWQGGTRPVEDSPAGSLRLSWGLLYQKGINVYLSPWIVPEIQKAIKLARDQRAQASLTKSSYLGRLPIEVFLLVIEIICPFKYTRIDISNVRNLLCVFDLEVPECFWKSRVQPHRHLFFELDLFEEEDYDSLGWQFLWLGFMDLVADTRDWEEAESSGLTNRGRVLEQIQGIITKFHELN
ncbi:unnamed protein product [Penicillium pancosmium]